MERFKVIGVTADEDRFLIEIELGRPSVINTLLYYISEKGLSILNPHFDLERVKLYAETEFESEWKKLLSDLVRDEYIKNFEMRTDLIPLAVVGECFSSGSLALYEVLEVLGKASVPLSKGVAGVSSIVMSIPKQFKVEAVNALHEHFYNKEKV